jgi:hypothetical protein
VIPIQHEAVQARQHGGEQDRHERQPSPAGQRGDKVRPDFATRFRHRSPLASMTGSPGNSQQPNVSRTAAEINGFLQSVCI